MSLNGCMSILFSDSEVTSKDMGKIDGPLLQ